MNRLSSAAKGLERLTARFSRSQLDPLLNPVLAAELPGLAIALLAELDELRSLRDEMNGGTA